MFSVGIIVASDKGAAGEREDKSGLLIEEILKAKNYNIKRRIIIPDDEDTIAKELIHMTDDLKVDLILTTGGTGFSLRDVTPEATIRICHRMANGVAEAIRYNSLQITPRGMLSRGVAGIRNQTLIINLPGSPKAVKESLEYILDSLEHGLEILKGDASECGKPV